MFSFKYISFKSRLGLKFQCYTFSLKLINVSHNYMQNYNRELGDLAKVMVSNGEHNYHCSNIQCT